MFNFLLMGTNYEQRKVDRYEKDGVSTSGVVEFVKMLGLDEKALTYKKTKKRNTKKT